MRKALNRVWELDRPLIQAAHSGSEEGLHSTVLQQFQIVFIAKGAPLVGVDHLRTPARRRPIQAAHDKALVQSDADANSFSKIPLESLTNPRGIFSDSVYATALTPAAPEAPQTPSGGLG